MHTTDGKGCFFRMGCQPAASKFDNKHDDNHLYYVLHNKQSERETTIITKTLQLAIGLGSMYTSHMGGKTDYFIDSK